jgi:dienelactone hydrolase
VTRHSGRPRLGLFASSVATAAALVVSTTAPVATASTTTTAPPRRSAVSTTHLTFVDTSRRTPATTTQPADDQRVLVTTIRYPTDATAPLPLIVLAHGLNGHPDMLDDLMETWASAGFVVAAPEFPRTNVGANGKALLADASQYPGDLSFVITEMLAANAAPGPLEGKIDPTHLGAAGISLGGMAVYGLVTNTCCIDPRVDAAILMSAVRPSFPSGRYVRQQIPVMLIHGDADTGYRYSVAAYPTLGTPKWFVTLHGGRHGPPFEDEPDEFDAFVRATTTAFWQRYLAGDRSAAARIVAGVKASTGKASLRRRL